MVKIYPIDGQGIAVPLRVVESNPAIKQFTYSRHKPEETILYKIIQNNWLSVQSQIEQDTGYPLPDFVIKKFEEYLRCGILTHGFLRAPCDSYNEEFLIAFSCKRRGFCPSCGARRMSETAAHLFEFYVDSVLNYLKESKIQNTIWCGLSMGGYLALRMYE